MIKKKDIVQIYNHFFQFKNDFRNKLAFESSYIYI